jgi:hypothetical protein
MKIATIIFSVLIPTMACNAPPVRHLKMTDMAMETPAAAETLPDLASPFSPSLQAEIAKIKAANAKVQAVIDDPANAWILKVKHVVRMEVVGDADGRTLHIGVDVGDESGRDDQQYVDEVQRELPPTLGGYSIVVEPHVLIMEQEER